jgi:hypothetical protein
MRKIVGALAVAALLAGCASAQRTVVDQGMDPGSPSAFIAAKNSRCDAETRIITPASSPVNTFSSHPQGDTDTNLDIQRRAYFSCVEQFTAPRR